MTKATSSQSGNALILILVAVALCGAVVFALTKYSANVNRDDDLIVDNRAADQVLDYSKSIAKAVVRMRMDGVAAEELLFDAPSDPAYKKHVKHQIFHPKGGHITWQDPSDGAVEEGNVPEWEFIKDPNPAPPFYGAIAVLHGIKRSACAAINQRINGSVKIPEYPGQPIAPSEYFTVSRILHPEGTIDNIYCYEDSSAPSEEYIYFHFLLDPTP